MKATFATFAVLPRTLCVVLLLGGMSLGDTVAKPASSPAPAKSAVHAPPKAEPAKPAPKSEPKAAPKPEPAPAPAKLAPAKPAPAPAPPPVAKVVSIQVEPNSLKTQAQKIDAFPVLINGRILQGDRDFFRFTAKAGRTLIFRSQTRTLLPYIPDAVPGWLDLCLVLWDADGKELVYTDDFRYDPDPVLIYTVPKDGEYFLEVRDVLYRGRPEFVYRLKAGMLPHLTHVFPLGALRGATTPLELFGANLPAATVPPRFPPTKTKSCSRFQPRSKPRSADTT